MWARVVDAFHKRWEISWLAKLLGDCGPNPEKSRFLHLRRIRIGLNVIMVKKSVGKFYDLTERESVLN